MRSVLEHLAAGDSQAEVPEAYLLRPSSQGQGPLLRAHEALNNQEVKEKEASLEEALENFAGCVLAISHDRWFIARLATHILSYENAG